MSDIFDNYFQEFLSEIQDDFGYDVYNYDGDGPNDRGLDDLSPIAVGAQTAVVPVNEVDVPNSGTPDFNINSNNDDGYGPDDRGLGGLSPNAGAQIAVSPINDSGEHNSGTSTEAAQSGWALGSADVTMLEEQLATPIEPGPSG